MLSHNERKILEERCITLENALYNDSERRNMPGAATLSEEGRMYKFKEREKLRKMLVENKMHTDLNVFERDKVWKRIKEIERKVVPEMTPRRHLRGIKSGTGDKTHYEPDQNIVSRELKFDKTYGHLLAEWKYLQRKLYPDDPNASNIERLRNE